MSQGVTYTLTINIVLDDLYEFLDNEEALDEVLTEFFETDILNTILDNLIAVLEWLDDILRQLLSATIALDSVFAFLETAAQALEFITGQLREMGEEAQQSGTEFLQALGEFFTSLPEVDTQGVDAIGKYLPGPDDINSIRVRIIDLIVEDPVNPGILRKLKQELITNNN